MSAQHTPGPWAIGEKNHIGPISREDDQTYGFVIPVAQVWLTDNAAANAQRIVQAVNAHDELVAALQLIADHSQAHAMVKRIARAALAKTGGAA